MRRTRTTSPLRQIGCILAVALLLVLRGPAAAPPALADSLPEPLFLPIPNGADPLLHRSMFKQPYRDDLEGLIQRRVIRVLVTYSPSGFFLEDGRPRGFEFELIEQYRKYLKTRVKPRSWPVIFAFIPMRFDELLPALAAGWGDIAAAGLKVTQDREAQVDFTDPYLDGVKEIVVTAKGVEGIDSLEDLAGRRVYVTPSSSYAQHLQELNERLVAKGLEAIRIEAADSRLLTEDILELVNAGTVEITVADEHLARLRAATMPNMAPRPDLVVHEGGRIAWAVRKDSPELRESLNHAIADNRKGTLIGNVLLNRYFDAPPHLTPSIDGPPMARLAELEPLFRKYGQAYGFEWTTLAALAYQESKLDQQAVSHVGAVGIMQVMTTTAETVHEGGADLTDLEQNIHAGTKYLAHLRDEVFADPDIALADRLDFALAAYNAGPRKIMALRRQAVEKGYDPNRWFFNVEALSRRQLGQETVAYVANVNKYMIAYKLAEKARDERIAARNGTEAEAEEKRDDEQNSVAKQ